MKMLRYSPLLLLLLSGLFLTGCYTSVASRGSGDRYPGNVSYNDDKYNNNDSYSTQDTSYNDDQGDVNIDNDPYWGIGYGGGFHHGHGWYNSGYYKTRNGNGHALRNNISKGNSSYGVRGRSEE